MAARESAAMAEALNWVRQNVLPAYAAAAAGVSVSGLYRAMRRHKIPCNGKPGRRPKPKRKR